jgi:hypothetical protein
LLDDVGLGHLNLPPKIKRQKMHQLKAGKNENPTTGLLALDYIHSCNPNSINVYGFDWKKTPTFTDPHLKREKFCPHDYEAEKLYCNEFFFTKPNIHHRI